MQNLSPASTTMKTRSIVFLVALLATAVRGAEEPLTAAEQQASFNASDYVYNPIADNNVITSAGGSRTPRFIEQWPALADQGISQTAFVINGCALRPPHVHMRAAGLLYAFSAANLSVGFVTEPEKTLIQNYITSGASTIFPIGLIHYQQNMDCNPAHYVISYNDPDPGTQVTIPAYKKLPPAAAASALGINVSQYEAMPEDVATPAFIPNSDPECVARCASAGVDVLAPASTLTEPSSTAGR